MLLTPISWHHQQVTYILKCLQHWGMDHVLSYLCCFLRVQIHLKILYSNFLFIHHETKVGISFYVGNTTIQAEICVASCLKCGVFCSTMQANSHTVLHSHTSNKIYDISIWMHIIWSRWVYWQRWINCKMKDQWAYQASSINPTTNFLTSADLSCWKLSTSCNIHKQKNKEIKCMQDLLWLWFSLD